MRKSLIGVVVGLVLAGSVQAEGFIDDPRGRVGIAAAKFDLEYEDFDLEFSSKGWEVFGGFEFNRYFALEGGYFDAGEETDTAGNVRGSLDASGIYASAIGSLPLGEVFSVFARAGVLFWQADQVTTVGTTTLITEDDGNEPFIGLGAAVMVEEALIRAEYRISEIGDYADLRAVSLALVWRF